MADDTEYKDILDQNVDDAKKSIRELENPDFRKLLQLEREGKDRKTVKEFLEPKIEETDDPEGSGAAETEDEDLVEQIEEDTSGGLLGGFSKEQLLAGGVVSGIVVGFLIAFVAPGMGSGMASPSEVESSVKELFIASGTDPGNIEVVSNEKRNGMYYISLNMTQQTRNGSRKVTQSFYVSPDGELLIRPRVRTPFGQTIPTVYAIDKTIQQLKARERMNQTQTETQSSTGSNTSSQ